MLLLGMSGERRASYALSGVSAEKLGLGSLIEYVEALESDGASVFEVPCSGAVKIAHDEGVIVSDNHVPVDVYAKHHKHAEHSCLMLGGRSAVRPRAGVRGQELALISSGRSTMGSCCAHLVRTAF